MNKMLAAAALASACLTGACAADSSAMPYTVGSTKGTSAPTAPEFAGIDHWIYTQPLTMQQLRGKVVLVEFWTYECINCIRTMPHVKEWHAKYAKDGLVVVGVHTPEYGHERILDNVQAAVKRFGITYPVAQDNAYKTWNAYGNRYWPALYLVDKQGRVTYAHFGEGAYMQTEAHIQALLAAK
jgi:thiol-disulfide isomerase/thioredoxin